MNDKIERTNLAELLADLNAGVFEQQLNAAISDVAANVVTHGKPGELTIKFKFKQIGDNQQVAISHSLKSVVPMSRGRITEESAADTPLHVLPGGKLVLFPDTKTKDMFARDPDVRPSPSAAQH